MSSPAHHEATKAAMKEAGCHVSQYGTDEDPVWECRYHLRESRTPGVCGEIDSAARIAYEAGRRDALTEAAREVNATASQALEGTGFSWGDEAHERAVNAARIAYGNAHSAIRALASTPTNEGADDART